MDNHSHLFNILFKVILYIILIIFILLSVNIVLPLKLRFPAWRLSPHLSSVQKEIDEYIHTDFVNSFGLITVALDKNYSTIVKTLDQNGDCVLERYFDNHGKPAVSINGNSALHRAYNEEGQWITSTYLDNNLNPITGKNGYSTIHRAYTVFGKTDTDMYFDVDGFPTIDLTGKYGVRYEYNNTQKISVITNLDANGNAMNNFDHYAIIKYTYTPDGRLQTQMYYDENGIPAKLSSGQYGYVYLNGKPICIDKDGHCVFILRHFLLNSIFIVLLIGGLLLLLILLSNRSLTWLLCFLYLAFITYMTMMNREIGSSVITWTLPPNYYLFFMDREILANIWLFVPLGTLLYKLSHMWEIIALPIVLTLLIETSQLVLDIGAFEFSDLIANSLGGMMGIVVCYLLEPIVNSVWNKLRALF